MFQDYRRLSDKERSVNISFKYNFGENDSRCEILIQNSLKINKTSFNQRTKSS